MEDCRLPSSLEWFYPSSSFLVDPRLSSKKSQTFLSLYCGIPCSLHCTHIRISAYQQELKIFQMRFSAKEFVVGVYGVKVVGDIGRVYAKINVMCEQIQPIQDEFRRNIRKEGETHTHGHTNTKCTKAQSDLIKDIVRAVLQVGRLFEWFGIDDGMIGKTKTGQIKVWYNPNHSINQPLIKCNSESQTITSLFKYLFKLMRSNYLQFLHQKGIHNWQQFIKAQSQWKQHTLHKNSIVHGNRAKITRISKQNMGKLQWSTIRRSSSKNTKHSIKSRQTQQPFHKHSRQNSIFTQLNHEQQHNQDPLDLRESATNTNTNTNQQNRSQASNHHGSASSSNMTTPQQRVFLPPSASTTPSTSLRATLLIKSHNPLLMQAPQFSVRLSHQASETKKMIRRLVDDDQDTIPMKGSIIVGKEVRKQVEGQLNTLDKMVKHEKLCNSMTPQEMILEEFKGIYQ